MAADSGDAHRVPAHAALPLRAAGASLVTDPHPHDRGMKGTFEGAILSNGNLYCSATPRPASTSALFVARRARTRPQPTTSAQGSSAATSWAASAQTTKTATTASPARRSWASSAAPCGMPPCSSPPSTPRSSVRPSTRRSAAPRSPSPCRHRSTPRPPSATTTRGSPGAAPLPAICARTGQRQDQGPGHHRRRPGVVSADGSHPDEPVPRLCARRAQPGGRRRVRPGTGRRAHRRAGKTTPQRLRVRELGHRPVKPPCEDDGSSKREVVPT